ncbi:MAG TPA: type II toxin-antitoxin system VapC family toxin [Isosphaeraceae bacterium]|jgi:predicted nucleic acid-binding protein|nr:type II toxin-antitoxin system VapC family toxin [Isosphaeraceae bacterium]
MLVYLDSVIVIYAIEGPPSFQARATSRLKALVAAGDQVALGDLTALECRVKPIRIRDTALLADYEAFLNAADVVRVPMPPAVYERATEIRACHNFKLADSLHLATAVEAACQVFLTNDSRLARYPDLTVEVLP